MAKPSESAHGSQIHCPNLARAGSATDRVFPRGPGATARFADADSPGSDSLGPHGAELLDQIVRQISNHDAVSAKVRHRADLFGQKLVGSGVYLQRRSDAGTQIRFSLSVQTDDRLVSVLHICDGRYLWMHDNLDGRAKVSRVDLNRLQRARAGQGREPLPMLMGGGLPQLLASLQQNFEVSPPQAVVFQELPVWALALRWKPSRLAQLLPDAKGLVDAAGNVRSEELPEQMPDRVFLLVGQDDLFPYHIDFRRTRSDENPSDAKPSEAVPSRSLTTMELFEVQFDAPLNPMLFVYKPTNIEINDRTDDYLCAEMWIDPVRGRGSTQRQAIIPGGRRN